MSSILRFFLQKISCFFFPPICLHCEEEMKNNCSLFCKECLELLSLLDLPQKQKVGWLFEKMGPAKTLYACFAKGSQVVFSKTIASYIVIQMDRLSWPLPDKIFVESFSSSAMRDLAREVAHLLQKPMVSSIEGEGFTYLFLASELHQKKVQEWQEKYPKVTIYGMGIFPVEERNVSCFSKNL